MDEVRGRNPPSSIVSAWLLPKDTYGYRRTRRPSSPRVCLPHRTPFPLVLFGRDPGCGKENDGPGLEKCPPLSHHPPMSPTGEKRNKIPETPGLRTYVCMYVHSSLVTRRLRDAADTGLPGSGRRRSSHPVSARRVRDNGNINGSGCRCCAM